MENLEPADAPAPQSPTDTPEPRDEYHPDDDLPPQAQHDNPWAFAIGDFDSHVDAWTHALNFTDQQPLGDAPLEQFILAEQWDHLHSDGG